MQADETTQEVDEAINRVLIAERDAQGAVEDCRRQAMQMREQARLKSRRVAERAERRELILLTAQSARHIPSGILGEALMQRSPLVLLIADVRDRARAPDIAGILRRQLGMAE